MASVHLNQLVKRFGATEVVHGIDLEIEDNEFVVLVGPSGCGKSTTLRMIAGLEKISAGTIRIGERVVNDVAPKDRGVAMVFQNYALYPHMNVFGNMAFGLRLRKTPQAEIQARVQRAADILELNEYLKRKPHELSGGQRQRVAMGRAIVRDPEVFLFDEPLSNLDAKLRTQMRIEIKRLHQRVASTIVYVTHDQVEAMTLADRIVVMRDGYIEQVGSPAEVFHNPANTFVAGFIGTPPMNLVPARIELDASGPSLRVGPEGRIPIPPRPGTRDLRAGQEVVLGVRAEDLTLDGGGFPGRAECRLEAVVDVVELLGSEIHVHVDLLEHKFIAKGEGRSEVRAGEAVRLSLNLDHLHVFDASTTRSLLGVE